MVKMCLEECYVNYKYKQIDWDETSVSCTYKELVKRNILGFKKYQTKFYDIELNKKQLIEHVSGVHSLGLYLISYGVDKLNKVIYWKLVERKY